MNSIETAQITHSSAGLISIYPVQIKHDVNSVELDHIAHPSAEILSFIYINKKNKCLKDSPESELVFLSKTFSVLSKVIYKIN